MAGVATSIIIAVYNDWVALDSCLASIAASTIASSSVEKQGDLDGFEVVVIDDGSDQPAPENIRQWAERLPMAIFKQTHQGVAAARNRGIGAAQGQILLFVDADCRLQTNCLGGLTSQVARSPKDDSFQLRLIGSRSTVVGRTEELRLLTIQEQALQPDGRIRYLNTAGFAIRRAHAGADGELFDRRVRRGEDTLLLATLMERGELPLFVSDAVVQHDISMSLMKCLLKDVRSAFLERRAYGLIAARGVRIRMTYGERLGLLRSAWRASAEYSLGRTAWFVLVARQGLQRAISLFCRIFPMKKGQRS
jgi:glycosyltransferase involved in cell wall biosynthesis